MIALPPTLRYQLRVNSIATRAAHAQGRREPDHFPVVKFFNPAGAATWLATELDPDEDTLFGLADLGLGFPELGSFSLAELTAVRLPYGLRIERDEAFTTTHRLDTWTTWSRRAGSIILAESALLRAASQPSGDAPDPDDAGDPPT
jgi:hypothetical protein